MNQADLRRLADERILDAKVLLDGSRWAFAYYTAGYAVECALKSCLLARMIHTGLVFREKWKADECRTHDLGELIGLAGLASELNAKLAASAAAAIPEGPPGGAFAVNWGTVNQWQVAVRYVAKAEGEARALYAAITDNPDGVLVWIKSYW